MTHSPQFWADKLPQSKRGEFWGLVESGFGGESAFYRARDSQYRFGGPNYDHNSTPDGV